MIRGCVHCPNFWLPLSFKTIESMRDSFQELSLRIPHNKERSLLLKIVRYKALVKNAALFSTVDIAVVITPTTYLYRPSFCISSLITVKYRTSTVEASRSTFTGDNSNDERRYKGIWILEWNNEIPSTYRRRYSNSHLDALLNIYFQSEMVCSDHLSGRSGS